MFHHERILSYTLFLHLSCTSYHHAFCSVAKYFSCMIFFLYNMRFELRIIFTCINVLDDHIKMILCLKEIFENFLSDLFHVSYQHHLFFRVLGPCSTKVQQGNESAFSLEATCYMKKVLIFMSLLWFQSKMAIGNDQLLSGDAICIVPGFL